MLDGIAIEMGDGSINVFFYEGFFSSSSSASSSASPSASNFTYARCSVCSFVCSLLVPSLVRG